MKIYALCVTLLTTILSIVLPTTHGLTAYTVFANSKTQWMEPYYSSDATGALLRRRRPGRANASEVLEDATAAARGAEAVAGGAEAAAGAAKSMAGGGWGGGRRATRVTLRQIYPGFPQSIIIFRSVPRSQPQGRKKKLDKKVKEQKKTEGVKVLIIKTTSAPRADPQSSYEASAQHEQVLSLSLGPPPQSVSQSLTQSHGPLQGSSNTPPKKPLPKAPQPQPIQPPISVPKPVPAPVPVPAQGTPQTVPQEVMPSPYHSHAQDLAGHGPNTPMPNQNSPSQQLPVQSPQYESQWPHHEHQAHPHEPHLGTQSHLLMSHQQPKEYSHLDYHLVPISPSQDPHLFHAGPPREDTHSHPPSAYGVQLRSGFDIPIPAAPASATTSTAPIVIAAPAPIASVTSVTSPTAATSAASVTSAAPVVLATPATSAVRAIPVVIAAPAANTTAAAQSTAASDVAVRAAGNVSDTVASAVADAVAGNVPDTVANAVAGAVADAVAAAVARAVAAATEPASRIPAPRAPKASSPPAAPAANSTAAITPNQR